MSREYKRDAIIDIYRGIGILCMLLGHIGFGGLVDYVIHAFHMPMFFLISGFLYREEWNGSFGQFMKRKAQTLLVPYLIFGLGHYLIWLLFPIFRQGGVSLDPLWHLVWVNTTKLPIAGALWFLPALFFTNLMFFGLRRKIKYDKFLVAVIVALVMVGHLCVKFLPFRFPWALDAALIGSGLFLVGYLLKKYRDLPGINKILHMQRWQFLLASIACLALILLNHDVNMRTGQYTYVILFWINAVLASILIYNLSSYLKKWGQKIKLIGHGTGLLESIGKHSLAYVCLNQIIILLWQMLLSGWENDDNTLLKLVIRCAVLGFTVLTLELMEKYLKISRVGNVKIRG